MAEALLSAAARRFGTNDRTKLAHLGMRIDLRIKILICLARAKLFRCTATESALLAASACLDELMSQSRELAPSKGSRKSARKAAAAEAAANGEEPPPAPPANDDVKPSPGSLLELWHEVARTFRRATELQALMGALNVSILRKDGQRQRRHELEHTFASTLSGRSDPMARSIALSIYPTLAEHLQDELHRVEREEAVEGDGGGEEEEAEDEAEE
jgi:hypothetical protein